jgi:thiol peroxidase
MATVTMHGNPLTLAGTAPDLGASLPGATVLDVNLAPVELASFAGKALVLLTVPSLDTPVCDIESKRFEAEAKAFGDSVVLAVASMDLPFAQKRWAAEAGAETSVLLSDHKDAKLGETLGVLLADLRLLARGVFVYGPDGKLAYKEIVPELTQEPDYEAALRAVKDVV